jgi:hypothetical protein
MARLLRGGPWGCIFAESEEGKEPRSERTKKNQQIAPTGEKPFLRVAREPFYGTTRVNSEKWEKGAGIKGIKAFNSRFQAFLNGLVGSLPFLGRAGRNCFGKQTPRKGLFFSINRGFWDCFWS